MLLIAIGLTLVALVVTRRPKQERDVEGFSRSQSALADIVERTRNDESYEEPT